MDAVIRGTEVTKRWGTRTALDRADLTVGTGITGLLGANGAGKTTLFGMVLGLHRPTSGRIEVLGLDPATAGPAVRARVGYSPEYHVLPEDMRAHDLVRHIAEVHGLPFREAMARASDVLWQVGLGEERLRPVGTMSTGQKQRVKLAQAIVHDPALVLLDEPTDGLDPVQRDDMLALIRRVGTEFGIDIVLSSHLLEEVERTCDAAVIIAGGRVVASGRIDELTHRTGELIVEVTDHANELILLLRGQGTLVDVQTEHDTGVIRMLVSAPEPQAGGDLTGIVRDALAASGAGVRRLARHSVSLEEVFLEVGT
jgi:ABC-2 type transport system ATP-binding protein